MTIDDERLRLWLDAAVESAFRAGAAEERAAVVAWLRASVAPAFADNWPSRLNHVYDAVRLRAESIERGEHRREEER